MRELEEEVVKSNRITKAMQEEGLQRRCIKRGGERVRQHLR